MVSALVGGRNSQDCLNGVGAPCRTESDPSEGLQSTGRGEDWWPLVEEKEETSFWILSGNGTARPTGHATWTEVLS